MSLVYKTIGSALVLLCGSTFAGANSAPDSTGKEGVYVAVGYGGRRMSSRDGRVWENVQQWSDQGADDSNNLISIAYGKGRFVAVGGGGWSKDTQAGHILVSKDGKEWAETAKYPNRVSPVSFQNELFVAGGPNRQLLSSSDGEKWEGGEAVQLPAEIPSWAFWFRSSAAGNGVFVFMGNAGKDQKIWWCLTSRDGKHVANLSLAAPGSRGLAFGAGVFVAVNPDGIQTSKDGQDWTPVSEKPLDDFRGLVWTGKIFVLTGKAGTYASPDGLSWKPYGKSSNGTILFGDDRGYIASGWPGKMSFSADGQTWVSSGQPLPGLGINRVVYGVPEK